MAVTQTMNSRAIRSVWMLSREYGDIAGAGGVKDVVAQLSKALARWNGRSVCIALPCYGFIDPVAFGFAPLPDPQRPQRQLTFDVAMNYVGRERDERVRIWHGSRDRVTIYLLEAERYLEKGGIYTYTRQEHQRESWKAQGAGHFDYFAMNVLLQKAALELMMILGERPEIIHCHDGHTAVAPAMMRECPGYRNYFRGTAAMVTIHNAGVGYHQEVSDLPFVHAISGLPMRVIERSCLEHSFDPFMAAGPYAAISTVSENYARELQETDDDYLTGWLGHRLRYNGVTISGVTNGIDPTDFDPRRGQEIGIPAAYDVLDDAEELSGKQRCKQDILDYLATPVHDDEQRAGFLFNEVQWPLFAFIGRLSQQKGVDILIDAIAEFLCERQAAQVVCLGSGSEMDEGAMGQLADDSRFSGRVCFLRGFAPLLANRIYAAADFFVIPSRYEPCGLTDYIAQLFGTVPVVHHVGGLVKVIDNVTGLAYTDNTPEQCAAAMLRACNLYDDKRRLRAMQRQSVQRINRYHTWGEVMKTYLKLYQQSRLALLGE